MFAPRVATTQTRGDAGSTDRFGQRTSRQARNERDGDQEREIVRENLTDPAAPRRLTWDFGKIPLFPPDRTSRPQASYPLPGIIQPKLSVGAVNDPLEHEADRVANEVMRMPDPDVSVAAAPPQVSRKCAACDEEGEEIQRKPTGSAETSLSEAPAIVHQVLRSPGQPLDAVTRAYFEPRFGNDFSQVRIHTDARAAESARSVHARAYTVGRHIVLGSAQPSLRSVAGQSLLAHELAHVVQQSRGGPAPELSALAPHEQDARSAANAIAAGASFVNVACNTGVGLARDDKRHKPEAPPDPAVVKEARLTELAGDPRKAHEAWKNLKLEEKTELVDKMIALYGAVFAHQFRDIAEHGKAQFTQYYWQPNTGPTPEQLRARGWRLLGMERTGTGATDVEVWVNAAGSTTRRDISTYHQKSRGTIVEPPPPCPCPESAFCDDLVKIIKEGWPAISAFDISVEGFAANPTGAHATNIEAEIARNRALARDFTTKLSNLQDEADKLGDEEKCIGDKASEEWDAATDQYTRILQRYNTLKQAPAGGADPNP